MYPPVEQELPLPQEEMGEPTPSPEELQFLQEEEARLAEAEEEEENEIILELVEYAEKEDIDLRLPLINIWKRNTYYFNNIQNIFFDPVARDYKTIDTVMEELRTAGVVTDIKVINVYRAWAESIIAALSVEVPAVEFSPDDAENPDDVETAEAYERIAKVVSKHNAAALILIKALTILYNQGVIFGRSTYKYDPAYGTVAKPAKIEQKSNRVADLRCSVCGEELESGVPESVIPELTSIPCEICGNVGPPEMIGRLEFFDEVIEWENTPKGRSFFDVFGPTYVKAPLYARSQADLGYLILRLEDHIAKFKTEYNNYDLTDVANDVDKYERWGRIPIEYNGGIPQDIATARYAYFRPWYYNVLDEEKSEILFRKYPNGLKVTVIGDTIVTKDHTGLDEEWTATFDPRNDYIHAEPAGSASIPIQDAENDTFNLGLQSIEFGIPETFAHPKTINFDKYSKSQANPGMVTPALPYAPDKNIGDGFHTIKAATLSGEYSTFEAGLQTKGQLVTGAMPSLFGGQSVAGSKTADEYRQSRAQALQRVQIPWRMIKVFWCGLIYKSVVHYAKNLLEDEKHPEKKNGSFINVWISKSALSGKAGQVEPDMNETLPQSWASKRDFITKLIELQIPEVAAILLHPNNSAMLKQYAAIPEIYVPGENDRNKQWAEFYKMAIGEAVEIDVDVDDHMVHSQVLKNILVSSIGVALPPEIYSICIEHYRAHEMAIQAKTIAPAGKAPAGEMPESATATTEG